MKTKEGNEVHLWDNFKVYLTFLKNYKFIFLVLLFVVLISESIEIGERYLFKVLVDKGTAYSAGTLIAAAFVQIVLILAIIFISIWIMKIAFKWVTFHFINKIESGLIIDLKRYYFNHILGLSHGFHVSHKTGALISRISRGSGAIETMTDTIIFNFSPLVLQFIVAAVSMASFSIKPVIILFVTMIVFIGFNFFSQLRQTPLQHNANRASDMEKANIADMMTNIDAIKYFGKEDIVKGRFAKISENTKKTTLIHWDYWKMHEVIQSTIIGFGTFSILFFTVKDFLVGALTLGDLTFIYTVYISLLGSLFSFTSGMRQFNRVMVDFEDLFQYGRVSNDIKDSENAGKYAVMGGEVEFREVSFNYGKRKIFDKLNLKVNQNEKVALVGHSGSGKTTLVKLLYRLYDVDKGEILIDGINIKDFKQETLRSELSIVPQEGILFDDTLYNNIAFSNPKATRKQVFDAIKFAQLDEFVKKLPNKEETIVGERGVKLSGGERQRVSIARAILANKKILVLDEATSALDSQTEHSIQADLRRLMQGRTSIIIAHRLSTIMHADKIVVFDKGKVVQIGTHKDLIRKPGMYRQLWRLQKGGYIGE
jgi:ATP-binding cassette subfamily B protein